MYYYAQSANSSSSFISFPVKDGYCLAILVASFTKVVRARETFISYFALTRNGATTDDSGRHFGCYQQDHSNLLRGLHEFLSERSELFRPRSGQASDEVTRGRLVSLEGLPFAFLVKHSNVGRSITRIWGFRLHFRESQTSMAECIDSTLTKTIECVCFVKNGQLYHFLDVRKC